MVWLEVWRCRWLAQEEMREEASMCWSRCWAERSRVRGWATVGMECCADLWSFAVIDAFPHIDEHRLLEVVDQRDVNWPWWSRGVEIVLSQRCQRRWHRIMVLVTRTLA